MSSSESTSSVRRAARAARSAERALRRYPELRELPERARAEVLARARRRTTGAGGYVVHVVAFFAVGVLGTAMVALFVAIEELLGPGAGRRADRSLELAATFIGMLCMVLAAVGVLAMVRRVDDAQVRRAIRADAASNRCAGCGYDLRGLIAIDGVVQCPECGGERTMAERAPSGSADRGDA